MSEHWTPATTEIHDAVRRRSYVPLDDEECGPDCPTCAGSGVSVVVPLSEFREMTRRRAELAVRASRHTRQLAQRDAECETLATSNAALRDQVAAGRGLVVVSLTAAALGAVAVVWSLLR